DPQIAKAIHRSPKRSTDRDRLLKPALQEASTPPQTIQTNTDYSDRERERGENNFSEESQADKWEVLKAEFEEWRSHLSQEQSDQFGRFVLERLRSLPQQPAIPDKWILSNWKFLKRQFEGQLLTHDRPTTVEVVSPPLSPQKTSPSENQRTTPLSPQTTSLQAVTPSPYKTPAQIRAEAERIDRERQTPEAMATARQALDAIRKRFGLQRKEIT
ncbi:MAG: hypothetical protein ACP5D4_20140, partial [Baaleninema sp.]